MEKFVHILTFYIVSNWLEIEYKTVSWLVHSTTWHDSHSIYLACLRIDALFQVIPKFYAIRKVSGEVPDLKSEEEFKTILAEMHKQLGILEKALENKKYFGGNN